MHNIALYHFQCVQSIYVLQYYSFQFRENATYYSKTAKPNRKVDFTYQT